MILWGWLKRERIERIGQFVQTLGTSLPLTEVSRALRARNAEKVSKMSLGPQDPKKSPKSPGALQKHSPDTFRRLYRDLPDCPRDFFETFWGPGAGGPERRFGDFFGISGPEGPGDLCKGRAGSQYKQFRNCLYKLCFYMGGRVSGGGFPVHDRCADPACMMGSLGEHVIC